MDHEYKDVEMMDLDDPMEVTTSLLPSSFILDYTLRPITNSPTGHHAFYSCRDSIR